MVEAVGAVVIKRGASWRSERQLVIGVELVVVSLHGVVAPQAAVVAVFERF